MARVADWKDRRHVGSLEALWGGIEIHADLVSPTSAFLTV